MTHQGNLLSSSFDGLMSETIKNIKPSGQQRREELEREVSMLQNLLSQEDKVREVLERVTSRTSGSAISIPSFLPPKMKELLAELAMVEDEIARLEGQICQLQKSLKREQEENKEIKSRHPTLSEILSSPPPCDADYSFYAPSPSPLSQVVPKRMAFETKALHFINKAIKGDFNLKDFTLVERMGNSRMISDQKENDFLDDAKFHDKVLRRSRVLPSPMRDPRHPTPLPRDRKQETSVKSRTTYMPAPIKLDENGQKWEPNKLSESIMKCLNFIYIRLLRTSRAMELEKSGPITRSVNLTGYSRSFRAPEPTLNSRQQDPYGVFDIEGSIPRDIGPYKNLVRFTSSSMDPKCISSSISLPLLKKLRDLMAHLRTADLRFLTNQQKLAFWINMYNACIMHGFLQYGVPSTPEKLFALMNKATLNVGGNTINAQAIEYFILRKPMPISANTTEVHRKVEKDVREAFGLEATDPNVTFALCCGTRSSPAVKIYTAEGVAAELEKSKLEYLQASVVVTTAKKIAFPELLLRNMSDFAVSTEFLVEWICQQLPTSGTLRKSMVDCFRGHGGGGQMRVSVEKIPYDCEFQYLLAV